MRVLVTGASGFLGRHLVRELVANGHAVSTLHRGEPLPEALSHTRASVLDSPASSAVDGVDTILHLAGRGDVQDSFAHPERYHLLNAVGTLKMLEAARAHGAGLVLASTQRVYSPQSLPIHEDTSPRPTTPYGYSKLVAETWVQSYSAMHGVRAMTSRIFSVFGPGQTIQGVGGVVTIFLRRCLAGEPLLVTGDQRQDFSYVEDAVRGLRLTAERGRAGEIYNLGSGVATTILRVAQVARAACASQAIIEQRPRPGHDGDLVADVRKARLELGYAARISLDEGIRRYVEWLRSHA